MKGLIPIPQPEDLESAYTTIQRGPALSEQNYALYSQWARFDPRLAEQLVATLFRDWKTLSPVALNGELLRQPWPAAFGVLVAMLAFHPTWTRSDKRQCAHWSKCALDSIKPGSSENFFIGTRSFAGKLLRDDAVASIKPYRKWGYLGRDLLIHSAPRESGTLLLPDTRDAVIEALSREKKRFTVSDYMARLGGSVDRRQAQRDLSRHPRLKQIGNTRARFYRAA